MTTTQPTLEFWFDFSSPYGYLAAQKIEALAARHGREVDWRPMLLGVALKAAGTQPLVDVPMKGDYSRRDFHRSARFHGIAEFRMPPRFPIPTQGPGRILLWAKSAAPDRAAAVAKAMLRAYWFEGRDISDPAVAAAAAAIAGVDASAARAAIDDPAWKDALKREVEEGLARGVFGSPYVFADGEPFWGLDRFDQLESHLASSSVASGRVRALSHLRLVVSDAEFAPTFAFYRDVLELPVAVHAPQTYAEFANAGGRLAIATEAVIGAVVGRSAPRAGDRVVVCLRVDDVDATAARVLARGATLVRQPHDEPAWLQRVAHLRDPAQHLVELWTPLAAPASPR